MFHWRAQPQLIDVGTAEIRMPLRATRASVYGIGQRSGVNPIRARPPR
jgi:hypothetical protein